LLGVSTDNPLDRVRKKLDSARRDARRSMKRRRGLQRLSVVFVVPRVQRTRSTTQPSTDFRKDLERFTQVEGVDFSSIVVNADPQPSPRSPFYYPGVVLIGHVHRAG
jgi:hypothetical protein